MDSRMGWKAASGVTSTTKMAFTWAEWCAWQQRGLHVEKRGQEGVPFSDRELKSLSFVRWRYQTGRILPLEYDSC